MCWSGCQFFVKSVVFPSGKLSLFSFYIFTMYILFWDSHFHIDIRNIDSVLPKIYLVGISSRCKYLDAWFCSCPGCAVSPHLSSIWCYLNGPTKCKDILLNQVLWNVNKRVNYVAQETPELKCKSLHFNMLI
jgi:hypothetical protein